MSAARKTTTGKKPSAALVAIEAIASRILILRGQRTILDADLAALYGVETRRLNEQVRRNTERFPEDFVFQVTPAEFANLKSQYATSSWGGRRKRPLALPNTAPSWPPWSSIVPAPPRSASTSCAPSCSCATRFSPKELARRLDQLEARIERKLSTHDQAIAGILDAIRKLMAPPPPPPEPKRRRIGFVHNDD